MSSSINTTRTSPIRMHPDNRASVLVTVSDELDHFFDIASGIELEMFVRDGGTLSASAQRRLVAWRREQSARAVTIPETPKVYAIAAADAPPTVRLKRERRPVLCLRPKIDFDDVPIAAAWLAKQKQVSANYAAAHISKSLNRSHGMPVEVLGYRFAEVQATGKDAYATVRDAINTTGKERYR